MGASFTDPCCNSLTITMPSGTTAANLHPQVGHEVQASLYIRSGVDNELAVGGIGLLGVDVVVEPRGALPDKARVMGHFRTAGQILFDPAHGGIRCLDARTLAHPEINDKLVAFGRREELLRYQLEKKPPRRSLRRPTARASPFLLMKKTIALPYSVLEAVQEIERFLLGLGSLVVVESLFYEGPAKERREHDGHNKGNDKGNGHGERQRNDELTGRYP